MKPLAWRKPQSASARPRRRKRWDMCSRPCTRFTAGSSRSRVSGLLGATGAQDSKRGSAEAGDTVALGKLDAVKTGDTLSAGKTAPASLVKVDPMPPVLSISIAAADRKADLQ